MQAYEKWDTNENKIEIWKMKFLFIFWLGVFIWWRIGAEDREYQVKRPQKKSKKKNEKKNWKKKDKKKLNANVSVLTYWNNSQSEKN